MGFGCKILYDEVGIDTDTLGPDNIVIFANGPLTGTKAPSSGRTEITTKSPLTGNIGTGNTGGVWGATLRRAGIASQGGMSLWTDGSGYRGMSGAISTR
jgi:aldehyde:ferredoxin oxidoreductase